MKKREFDYALFSENELVFSADAYTQEEAERIAYEEYGKPRDAYETIESYCAFRCMSDMEDGLNRGCYIYGFKKGARGSFKVWVVRYK